MRTSYSAIETYLQCPQKYKFQEIDRIKTAKSKEAVFGTLIHDALKFMFQRGPLFPTLDEVVAYFREKLTNSQISKNEAELKIYKEEGVRMLENFYKKNSPWNFTVLDLESHFEVPLNDEKSGETHILSGKIDRIDKLADGVYEIIDYKTAKRMPSQESLNNNLQLSLYTLGIEKRWPHIKPASVKLSLYFLKHGEKLSVAATAETVERAKNHILTAISQIQSRLRQNREFEPLPGPLCDWCGFKPICPAWRHMYRKQEPVNAEQDIEKIIKEYFEAKKTEVQIKARLAELQNHIKNYMEKEGLTRVFGDDGYISKTAQFRYKYNFDKIREILEPIGKWQEILDADEKKLKNLLRELPEEIARKIKESGIETKEFFTLKTSLKKIKNPADTAGEASFFF